MNIIEEIRAYLDTLDSQKAHKNLKNRFKQYKDIILSIEEAKILIKHPICQIILQTIFVDGKIITEKNINERIGDNKMLNAICNAYIEENHIELVKLLSREEELDLAIRMSSGDEEARKILITSNLGLVKHSIMQIASQYNLSKGTLSNIYDDLFQDGVEALIKSLNKYDYTRGNRVSTYVVYGIQKAIYSGIEAQIFQLKLSQKQIDDIKKMRKLQNELAIEQGTNASFKQIADTLKKDEKEVKEKLQLYQGTISLDSFSEETNLHEVIKDEKTNIEEKYEMKELFQTLADLILDCLAEKRITQKEFLVLCLRLGLIDGKNRNYEEVRKKLNISWQRAQQLMRACIKKLRKCKKIKDFGNENHLWEMAEKKEIIHSITELRAKYPSVTHEQLKDGLKSLTERQQEVLIMSAGEELKEQYEIKSSSKEYTVLIRGLKELEKYITETLKVVSSSQESEILGNLKLLTVAANQIKWMQKEERIVCRKYNMVCGSVIPKEEVTNILENVLDKKDANKEAKEYEETKIREALLVILLNTAKESEVDYEALLPYIKNIFEKRLQEMYPEIDSKKIKIALDDVLINYLGEQQFVAKLNLYPKRVFNRKS